MKAPKNCQHKNKIDVVSDIFHLPIVAVILILIAISFALGNNIGYWSGIIIMLLIGICLIKLFIKIIGVKKCKTCGEVIWE